MSRIDNTELKNPAEKYFEWAGNSGCFQYFDKSLADGDRKGRNVDVPLPFQFMVLEILCCVAGWDKRGSARIHSNDVLNQKEEILNVRSFSNGWHIASGVWDDIKDKVKAAGGEFAKTIYIAYKGDEDGRPNPKSRELKIGHIRIKTAVLKAWIDFGEKHDYYNQAIVVKTATKQKNGNNEYFVPVFEQVEITPASDEKAKKLTVELLKFLKVYFKNTQPDTPHPPLNPDVKQESEKVSDRKEAEKF